MTQLCRVSVGLRSSIWRLSTSLAISTGTGFMPRRYASFEGQGQMPLDLQRSARSGGQQFDRGLIGNVIGDRW